MIVDDAATIRKMVGFTLKPSGYEILEAADGVEALNALRQRSVDLVITDINMPRMDGLELISQARSLPNHSKTPIILLTTESNAAKKSQGKAAGATGWIAKPFEQEQLRAVVTRVLPN